MGRVRDSIKSYSMALLLIVSVGARAQSDSCQQSRRLLHRTVEKTDSTAKNMFNITLNFMAHGEVRDGGLPKPVNSASIVEKNSNFLLGRTRLIFNYKRTWLEAKLVLQNNAVWGTKNNVSVGLNETWVKMTAKCGLFGQIGRVALSYDDERIIGPNDFAMASRSHDVLRVGYEGHGHKVHAILAYNQVADSINLNNYYENGAQYYKSMQTLWYHYDIPKFPLGVSLLFMNVGQQAGLYSDINNQPSTQYQQMWGGYVNYHPRYFTLEASYYRQTGKIVDVYKQYSRIKAWMASAKATVSPSDRYGFELGYDYLSGDEYVPVTYGGNPLGMPRHNYEGGFSPMNGSHTKFYGIMDYFYESAYINGFTPGLQNAFVGAFGKPMKAMTLCARYHYLAVATKLTDLDKTLGHCIDLQARYVFTKDISLTASYTQMIGTETMNRLKQGAGNERARWGWFSLIVNPSLFTKKW